MRLATIVSVAAAPVAQADRLETLEAVGLEAVFVGEAYGFDAPGFLGYLAARTKRLELGTGALNVFSRSAALLAMTAAGLDAASGGRFVLGLGASGPQLVEGFHGMRYEHPVARTRAVIEICRSAWRREPVMHEGVVAVPVPGGVGRPVKLAVRPLRPAIPVYVAGLGERNVELAAELADGWLSLLFVPERAGAVWGAALKAGRARRDPGLGQLEVVAGGLAAVVDDATEVRRLRDEARPHLALYIGAMGSRSSNYYNRLVRRYGFENEAEQIQALYLDGQRGQAEAAVTDELLAAFTLIGPRGWVAERIAAHREAGVTCLAIEPVGGDDVGTVAAFRELLDA